MARGLFVEPFYGGSHRAFLDGLVRHSCHEIETLTLPEGEWRRRMRRGAQELAEPARSLPCEFDFLVVSDMLDLPAFLALTRPKFERVPVLAYFHENQMTYPRLRGTKFNSWFGQINYMTALAADAVAFNSEFHRADFLGALRALLAQPNNWLTEAGVEAVVSKSSVLPVGVELPHPPTPSPRLGRGGARDDVPRTILWNHRWEFDKAPELFARTLHGLKERGVPFRLIVAGEPGENPSPAITDLPDEFPDEIVHFGYAPSKEEYWPAAVGERHRRQHDSPRVLRRRDGGGDGGRVACPARRAGTTTRTSCRPSSTSRCCGIRKPSFQRSSKRCSRANCRI